MKKIATTIFIVFTIICTFYQTEFALAVPLDSGPNSGPTVSLECRTHPIGPEFNNCTGRIIFEGHGNPYHVRWREGSSSWVSGESGNKIAYTSRRRCNEPIAQNPIEFQAEDRVGIWSNVASATCASPNPNPSIP